MTQKDILPNPIGEKQPEQECVYCAADQAYEQVMSSSQINPDKTVGNTCSKE